MKKTLEPKPVFRFRGLTEEDILTALNDPDPENPIRAEVNRLVTAYTDTFQHKPSNILHIYPRWPIEIVALRLTEHCFNKKA